MNNKALLAIILISVLLILAGCGKKQCDTKSDCLVKSSCQIASCVKGECKYVIKSGCTCGDGLCLEGENPCNCPEDCKPACTGSLGKYLNYSCDSKQNCVTMVKSGVQKQQQKTESVQILDINKLMIDLTAKYSYDEPFNVDSSQFFISLKIEKSDSSVKDVVINKVKLISHTGTFNKNTKKWENDEIQPLAEEDVKRKLWNEDTIFNTTMPISFEEEIKNNSKQKEVWVVIEVEYKVFDSIGREVTKNYEYEKELSFLFVNPTKEKECPPRKEWDDGNPCTIESCSETTDFFVKRTMKPSCAGNFICETGEDECNAPSDCGPCEGSVGDYLEKICSGGCKTKLKRGVVVNSEPVINTKNLNDITFDIKTEFNRPFNVKTDSFIVEFKLIKIGTATGVVINEVQIIDKSTTQTQISDQIINKPFPTEGSSYRVTMDALPQLSTSINGEVKKKPALKIFYKYTSITGTTSRDNNGDFEVPLGDVTFINPGVE